MVNNIIDKEKILKNIDYIYKENFKNIETSLNQQIDLINKDNNKYSSLELFINNLDSNSKIKNNKIKIKYNDSYSKYDNKNFYIYEFDKKISKKYKLFLLDDEDYGSTLFKKYWLYKKKENRTYIKRKHNNLLFNMLSYYELLKSYPYTNSVVDNDFIIKNNNNYNKGQKFYYENLDYRNNNLDNEFIYFYKENLVKNMHEILKKKNNILKKYFKNINPNISISKIFKLMYTLTYKYNNHKYGVGSMYKIINKLKDINIYYEKNKKYLKNNNFFFDKKTYSVTDFKLFLKCYYNLNYNDKKLKYLDNYYEDILFNISNINKKFYKKQLELEQNGGLFDFDDIGLYMNVQKDKDKELEFSSISIWFDIFNIKNNNFHPFINSNLVYKLSDIKKETKYGRFDFLKKKIIKIFLLYILNYKYTNIDEKELFNINETIKNNRNKNKIFIFKI
jgi:hypothetical protein